MLRVLMERGHGGRGMKKYGHWWTLILPIFGGGVKIIVRHHSCGKETYESDPEEAEVNVREWGKMEYERLHFGS